MDIDGFGKSYVENFNKLGWLNDISDIYNLDYSEISKLDGFGERSVEKLSKAIDKAKSNPIHRLLNGLSIHHLGKKASKLIAQNIDSVFDLQNWTEENFVEIKDVGPVVAQNVIEWFDNDDNIAILKRLESYGVNMQQTEQDRPRSIKANAPLQGKTILFTGSLQEMTRKQAQEIAEENGAKNISAVSSNLNILVVGEKAGSKLKKAQALGTVQILTELEYLELIKQ
jgi:DNA ligase (NAD+)